MTVITVHDLHYDLDVFGLDLVYRRLSAALGHSLIKICRSPPAWYVVAVAQ